MKKWFSIAVFLFAHSYLFAQVDSVSISVHTEDASAFQKRERFKYLHRSMISEPRLWKATLQPFATTTSKYPTEQYLANFVYFRKNYPYFQYGVSNRIGYEMKIGKVVSIMPELQTTYAFHGNDITSTVNFSLRYYVGQKRAMTLNKTGNNLLASYLEARVNEIFGVYSLTRTADGRHFVRETIFDYMPHSMTFSYGVQKRLGKFGFVDVSGGLTLDFDSASFYRGGFYPGDILPAVKLSWGFATPPKTR